MDRLEAIHTFVRVAELGSFTAAAQQLNLARSVVTRQIAALESHLGVKLMARSTRRLSLTSAGTTFLEKARVILNLLEAAETDLSRDNALPRGHIRVGLPLTYGLHYLTPLLLTFLNQYPEVSMEMDYTDRRVNLIEEGVDLSLRVTSKLNHNDVVRKLGECALVTLASPQYLTRHGTPTDPSELNQHACLVYQTNSGPMPWLFEREGQTENMNLQGRLMANNGEALLKAAINGMGITQQPDFIAQVGLSTGEVVPILPTFSPKNLGIYAVLPSNRHIPHRVRVLVDFLSRQLQTSQ